MMKRLLATSILAAGLQATSAFADASVVAVYETTPDKIWEMVAQRLGVTRAPSLLYHFPSKVALRQQHLP